MGKSGNLGPWTPPRNKAAAVGLPPWKRIQVGAVRRDTISGVYPGDLEQGARVRVIINLDKSFALVFSGVTLQPTI
jgi:hypothetical protein